MDSRGGDEPRTGRGRSREEPFSVSGDLHHLQQNLLNSLGFDILRRWEKYWPPRSCFFVLLASILSMSVYAGGMRHAQVTSLTCDCVTCVTIHCGMGRHPRPEGGQLGCGGSGQHWGGVGGREHRTILRLGDLILLRVFSQDREGCYWLWSWFGDRV